MQAHILARMARTRSWIEMTFFYVLFYNIKIVEFTSAHIATI